MKKSIVIALITGIAAVTALTGCVSDADRASENLSTAAEQFEIARKVTAINGITGAEIMVIEGRCSVETSGSGLSGALEVTCKVSPDQYKKNYVYLSDNVVVSVEQLDPIDVSVYNYRYIIKPQTIVPNIDVQSDVQ